MVAGPRRSGRSYLHQHRRGDWAGVDHQSGDLDAVHIGYGDGGGAVLRHEGGVAQAEHDGVGVGDVDGAGVLVDAGGQDEVLAEKQGVVDVRQRGGGLGDEEGADGQRVAALVAVGPGNAGGVALGVGDEDVEGAVAVDVEEGLLAADRGRRQHGVAVAGGVLRDRRALHAGEDHVPHAARPTADGAVAGVPLLLGAGVDVAGDEGVGDEAAAGKAAVRVGELQRAVDVHAAEVSSLRDGPLQDRRVVDRHVFERSPEIVRDVAVAVGEIGSEIAVNGHRLRALAQAGDAFVIAYLCLRAIGPGHKEDLVAVCAELRLGVNGVQGVLDIGSRHAGIENL